MKDIQSGFPGGDLTGGTVKGTGTVNLLAKWTAVDTIGDSRFYDNGTKAGINETSPDAEGLTIKSTLDQGLVFSLKGAITHPFTSFAEADTFAGFEILSINNGGLLVETFMAGNQNSVLFKSYMQFAQTAKNQALFRIDVYESNGGTGSQAIGNNDYAFSIANADVDKFSVLGNGDTRILGTYRSDTLTVNRVTKADGNKDIVDSLITDDGTNILVNQDRVFLNTGTARPFAGNTPHLWIFSASVGYTPNLAGNDIVIESSVEAAMTFLSTPTTGGYIYFQDAINANTTRFGFDHNDDKYKWRIAGSNRMEFSVSQGLNIVPTTTGKGVTVDGAAGSIGNPVVWIKSDGISGGNDRSELKLTDNSGFGFSWQYNEFDNSLICYRRTGTNKVFEIHDNQKYWGGRSGDNPLDYRLQVPTGARASMETGTQNNGMIYYDTTNNVLRKRVAGAWSDLA